MKFIVLLYCTTLVAHCIAKSLDSKSYPTEPTSTSSWEGWMINRFSILFFILPCAVLYYIPESRSYARKGCHVAIDLVANGLKAAMSGSVTSPNCYETGCLSYSSKKFANFPVSQDSVVSSVQKDQFNTSHLRRRHRVKQESKVEEDKTRVHDKRRHRHNERSKCTREDKNGVRHGHSATQHHQSQSTPKTSSKEPVPLPASHVYQEKKITGFYYPGTRNEDDAGPGYSTSFVTSGVKPSSNYRQGSSSTMGEEEYPQTVSKHRSRPSRRSRIEDSLYPENDGPTRDCEGFLLTDLVQKNSHDLDSNVGFGTTTVDYPEREDAGILSPREDSTSTVQEFEDAVANWDGDTSQRAKIQHEEIDDCENVDIVPADTFETQVQGSAPEENRPGRTVPTRKVNFQKKHRDKGRKKLPEDVVNSTATTRSEEVMLLLGEQIAKLEKTIRMMKPGDVTKNERGQGSFHIHDYAVRNIETVIKDMKRSFSKVDRERMKRRRGSSRDPPTRAQDGADSSTSIVEEAECRVEDEPSIEIGEEDLFFGSETMLGDDDEPGPIVTNRVKPYLVRTFDWLFTGCPGACGEKQHGVGKGGDLRTGAEWIP